MPAFSKENGGRLTTIQIQVLVHEIKGIPYRVVEAQGDLAAHVVADTGGVAPTWGSVAEPPAGVPAYRQPATAADGNVSGSSTAGALAFGRACAACHGSHGQGVVKESKTCRKINDAVALRLMSDQLLRRYAITGRPDVGMPNFGQSRERDVHFQPLTDQEITDLVALLEFWRQPAVHSDLVKD